TFRSALHGLGRAPWSALLPRPDWSFLRLFRLMRRDPPDHNRVLGPGWPANPSSTSQPSDWVRSSGSSSSLPGAFLPKHFQLLRKARRVLACFPLLLSV